MYSAKLLRVALALAFVAFLVPRCPAQGQSQRPEGRYVGIEISSTSVRAVMIEYLPDGTVKPVTLGDAGGVEKQTDLRESAVMKQGVRVYPRAALERVVKAVREYYHDLARAHQLGPDRFFIFASSGAVGGAVNIDALAELLAQAEGGLRPLEKVTAADELRLALLGAVPPGELSNSVFVDLGGGDGKIGVARRLARGNYDVRAQELLGVTSFRDRAQDLAKKAGKNFAQAAGAVRAEQVLKIKDFLQRTEGARGREQVYVIGGAPYALTTLMYPDQVGNKKVRIDYAKLKQYQALLAANPAPVLEPALLRKFGAPPADKKVRARYEKEVRNIQDRFKPPKLLVVGEMLEAVFEGLGLNQTDKSITFIDDQFAWNRKYVEEKSRGVLPATVAQIHELESELRRLSESGEEFRKAQEKQKARVEEMERTLGQAVGSLKTQLEKVKPDDSRLNEVRGGLRKLEAAVAAEKSLLDSWEKNWKAIAQKLDSRPKDHELLARELTAIKEKTGRLAQWGDKLKGIEDHVKALDEALLTQHKALEALGEKQGLAAGDVRKQMAAGLAELKAVKDEVAALKVAEGVRLMELKQDLAKDVKGLVQGQKVAVDLLVDNQGVMAVKLKSWRDEQKTAVQELETKLVDISAELGRLKAAVGKGTAEGQVTAKELGQVAGGLKDVQARAEELGHSLKQLRTALANAKPAPITVAAKELGEVGSGLNDLRARVEQLDKSLKRVEATLVNDLPAPTTGSAGPAPATFNVRLPVEASLYVNGVLCPLKGPAVSFRSPVLVPGRVYTYTLRAEQTGAGPTARAVKRVSFRAGDVVTVDFSQLGERNGGTAGADEPANKGPESLPAPRR
jgi:uncharacterized protein (TIGR03000 family)